VTPRAGGARLSLCACVALAVVSVWAYPAGAPPATTGGFGEDSCVKCHNSYELNAGRAQGLGDLKVSGLPMRYQSGEMYRVKVEVAHVADRSVWGFEAAARLAGSGSQAGEFAVTGGRLQTSLEKGIQYVSHTADGIFSPVFEFDWVAPSAPSGDVIVDVAGNAADGDASPVGDYIYTTTVTIPPASP